MPPCPHLGAVNPLVELAGAVAPAERYGAARPVGGPLSRRRNRVTAKNDLSHSQMSTTMKQPRTMFPSLVDVMTMLVVWI